MNIIKATDIGRDGITKTLEEIKKKMAHPENIYITVDIDSLDPSYAPGTSTPQFGGLNSRQLLDLLRGSFTTVR